MSGGRCSIRRRSQVAHHDRNRRIAARRDRRDASRHRFRAAGHREGTAGVRQRRIHSRLVAMLDLAGISAGKISLLLLRVITTRHSRRRLLNMFSFGLARVGHRR